MHLLFVTCNLFLIPQVEMCFSPLGDLYFLIATWRFRVKAAIDVLCAFCFHLSWYLCILSPRNNNMTCQDIFEKTCYPRVKKTWGLRLAPTICYMLSIFYPLGANWTFPQGDLYFLIAIWRFRVKVANDVFCTFSFHLSWYLCDPITRISIFQTS